MRAAPLPAPLKRRASQNAQGAARFATLDQSNADVFWLAMEPIPAAHPPPCVFRVERDNYGRLWLLDSPISRDFKWPLDYEVVFVLDE